MPTIPTDLFIRALGRHPTLVVFVLFMTMVTGVWSMTMFAQRSDLDDVYGDMATLKMKIDDIKGEIEYLSSSVRVDSLQGQIRTLNAEIYQLERLDASGEANGRDLDRLIMLRSDREEVQRELERVIRNGG